jgi:hypothetical protein
LNTFKINCDHKKILYLQIKLPCKKSGLQYQAQEMMENLNNCTLKS